VAIADGRIVCRHWADILACFSAKVAGWDYV